jgi:hypothetical protein
MDIPARMPGAGSRQGWPGDVAGATEMARCGDGYGGQALGTEAGCQARATDGPGGMRSSWMYGCVRDPVGKPARRDAGRGRSAGPRRANRTTEIEVPTGTRAGARATASMTSVECDGFSPP